MTAELEILDSPRLLAGTKADLEVTCYLDGTATDPTGTPTYSIADEDGNVLASGNATVVGSNTGMLRASPTAAAMANVNRLTITWGNVILAGGTAITLTTYAEVVGDMLFTEAQARAFHNSKLTNSSTYSDDDIRRGHDQIMDTFQALLGYPLGRRYFRETLDGTGSAKLRLENRYVRTLRQIQTRASGGTTWTSFTSTELADTFARRWGLIERESGAEFTEGVQNVRVSYEAGKEIHPRLRRAALQVLVSQLVPSNLPDRALFETTTVGQFRLAVAGDEDHPFGLPDVDTVIRDLREMSIW